MHAVDPLLLILCQSILQAVRRARGGVNTVAISRPAEIAGGMKCFEVIRLSCMRIPALRGGLMSESTGVTPPHAP